MSARSSLPHAHRAFRATGTRHLRLFAVAGVAAIMLSVAPATALARTTGVDSATYVHSVCTALSTYSTRATALQASTNLDSAKSLTDVRTQIVSFLGGLKSATSTAVTSLKNAGAPNIKNGNKIASGFVREVSAIRDAFANAERLARKLSTSSLSAFNRGAAAITKLEKDAGKRPANIRAGLSQHPSLQAAQVSDPACQGLK